MHERPEFAIILRGVRTLGTQSRNVRTLSTQSRNSQLKINNRFPLRNRKFASLNFKHNAESIALVLLMLSTMSILVVSVSAASGPCSLSVKIIPTGSGTVTLTPPGSPAGTYTPCVPISFKATPSAGYYFVGWALSAPGSTAGDGQMYYFTYQNPTPNFKLNATIGGNQRLLAYFQPQNQWVRSSNNPILTASASGWDESWVASLEYSPTRTGRME